VQSLFSRDTGTPKVGERPWWRRAFERATLQGPAYRTRRLAARATFFGLLTVSALFGALSGLMLVYSIDLPQMEDLARYRPSTTTELYDIHGKEFGSFALERRCHMRIFLWCRVRRFFQSKTRALNATGG
jgi:penicillin-binding protein 1A